MTRWATGWVAVLLAIAAAPALGEVYKWVDETGKVNYGDKPPPGRARPLDEDSGRVSVVQGMGRDEIERLRVRYEQQRLQELEREVEALRAREQLLASAAPPPEYVEVYVPAYAHPWPWRRQPRFGHPERRPDHPVHRPRPSLRGQPLRDR